MIIKYANRAKTQLARSISANEGIISVISGQGSLFPSLTQGAQLFPLTLVSIADQSQFEICYVLARNADSMTVLRGQEGTTAQAFESGDIVSLNMTASVFGLFPQAGYLGVYDPDIARTIGGYKKNAVLADGNIAGTLWLSLQDNNKTPPSHEATSWWLKLDFVSLGTQLGSFVSGLLGMRPQDKQGISLFTNGDNGLPVYSDVAGHKIDLAPQSTLDKVNKDLQGLKNHAVISDAWSSDDTSISSIRIMHNQPHNRVGVVSADGKHDLILPNIDNLTDLNNDLQGLKSHAVISDAWSSDDTSISSIRIMHDQPHNRVGVVSADGQHDLILPNIDNLTDLNNDLQSFKADAVTGHGYGPGDHRIPNIWANNNSDRQRLQANVEGKNDIIAASIDDVSDEKNRAQAAEATLLSNSYGMSGPDIQGRSLYTNGKTGRVTYWDQKQYRGDLAWASDIDNLAQRFQIWTAEAAHGDWVYFPRSIDNFWNDGNTCNVMIFMNVISRDWSTIDNRDNTIYFCNISRDSFGKSEIEYNRFRLSVQHYYTGNEDAKGRNAGKTLIQFLAITAS
ncbi:hypothetical protein [Aristophania vespae]|uniref:hypothetical protein n=1 Tax=Aristophania vespae TaxID=2697033 RepID=UPI0023514A69|nr:hypothetical protein [Aristophania vespae]UMM63130.1 hypothetical protein DM15PD_00840 [Aristophania vespae]